MAEALNLQEQSFAEVFAVLNRDFPIDALASLVGAMRFELDTTPHAETVIAFDANVLLRLSNHRRAEDIVDHLRTAFPGRIILPGQVIQEFWNNQFQAIATISTAISKKLDELNDIIINIDFRYGEFYDKFNGLIGEFREDFGYVFDENTIRRTKIFIELLQEKSIVPFMPRTMLSDPAKARKRTKTPPGFKDDLDGDFYVWSDLLLGLVTLRSEGVNTGRVMLVTLDKKIDWSRDGVPHPILSAEIKAICGAQFETITVDGLARRLLD